MSQYDKAVQWVAAYESARLQGQRPTTRELESSALVVLVADVFDRDVSVTAEDVRDLMPSNVGGQLIPQPKLYNFPRPMGAPDAGEQA